MFLLGGGVSAAPARGRAPAPATGWYNHAPRTNNKTNAFNCVLIWAVAHIETLRPDSHRSELALKSKVHDTTRSKHANVARGKIGQKGELVRHEKTLLGRSDTGVVKNGRNLNVP